MLSKCANPVCSATFRYLHQGRIFQLVPGPAVEWAAVENGLLPVERFWLCDVCSREMKVIWDGARAKVVRLPEKEILNGKTLPPSPENGPMPMPMPMKDRPYQDKLYRERLAQERLSQEKLSQEKPNKETPPQVTPLPTKLPPTRLRAAFAGRRRSR